MRKTIVLLSSTVAFGTLILIGAQDPGNQLPEGDGKTAVLADCTKCHEVSKVTHSRQTQISWQQTVDNMITRGAQIPDDDVPVIVTYLAANFGQINVNTASQAQLQSFIGFSEEESKAIIAYREANGKIRNFEQLSKVAGLDASKLQAKHELIAFAQ